MRNTEITRRVLAWAEKEGLVDPADVPAITAELDAADAEAAPPAPVAVAAPPTPVATTEGDYSGMTVEEMKAESRRLAATSPALVARQREQLYEALETAVEASWELDEEQLLTFEVGEDDDLDEVTTTPDIVAVVDAIRQLPDFSETDLARMVDLVGEDELTATAYVIQSFEQAQDNEHEANLTAEFQANELPKVDAGLDALLARERYAGAMTKQELDSALMAAVLADESIQSAADLPADKLLGIAEGIIREQAFVKQAEAQAASDTELQRELALAAGISMDSKNAEGETVYRTIVNDEGENVQIPVMTAIIPKISDSARQAWLNALTEEEQFEMAAELDAKTAYIDEGISDEEVAERTKERERREEAAVERFREEQAGKRRDPITIGSSEDSTPSPEVVVAPGRDVPETTTTVSAADFIAQQNQALEDSWGEG